MKDKLIYFDNAASTRLDERVLEAMTPYFFEKYAVATSDFGYTLGLEAREGLEGARKTLAARLGAGPEEIVFTSGSTESSNLAIKGAARAQKEKGRHIITTAIEDFPVLHSLRTLEGEGFKITKLGVDSEGFVDPSELRGEIGDDTILVSIQHANQEIGTLQDIGRIAEICREKDVLFHTDATHTFPGVSPDLKEMPADLITVTAQLIHGPRGIGALYVRKGTPLKKVMDGGYQEFDMRGGPENIPGAVGFAKAVELATPEETARIRELRYRLIDRILEEVPDVTLNGPREARTPQNANITFHYVEGESITLHLDMRGIAVSTGSACFSRSLEASHVIMGIGGDHERAHGSVRFTLGRYNTKEDVDRAVDEISDIVEKLRTISPLSKE